MAQGAWETWLPWKNMIRFRTHYSETGHLAIPSILNWRSWRRWQEGHADTPWFHFTLPPWKQMNLPRERFPPHTRRKGDILIIRDKEFGAEKSLQTLLNSPYLPGYFFTKYCPSPMPSVLSILHNILTLYLNVTNASYSGHCFWSPFSCENSQRHVKIQ